MTARTFNIAGPCVPVEHHMLPPERRLSRVLRLIAQRGGVIAISTEPRGGKSG